MFQTMLNRAFMTAILMVTASTLAMPQEDIFRNGTEFGIGARAIGLGGAYVAVGDDYSASYWNPAALALIRRFEVSGGMTHLIRENGASFGGQVTNDQFSITRLKALGFAYPVPTYRGSLVFSFGYNRIKEYDANFAFNTFNPLPEDSVQQGWREREEGSLNNWTIAGAVDLSPRLSAGVGLNIWTGRDTYQFTEKEVDNLDIYTFDRYRRDNLVESDVNGVNFTFGALYRVNSFIRLAATMSTPVTLTVNENWSTAEETTFDDFSVDRAEDSGVFEYKIRSPFKFVVGGSMNLMGLLLSGQFEFVDWTQIRYESEPPIEGLTRAEANDNIVERYRLVRRTRLGAELTLPGSATQIRAGYFRDPLPYKWATDRDDRIYYSLGIGLLLDKQVKLDVAYVLGKWEEINPGLNNYVTRVSENITQSKVFATLSFRL